MLIILERQLLDIAAALGEDGDKAVLFKTLDGFTHRRARAVVVDREGVLAELAARDVLVFQYLVPDVIVNLIDYCSPCCHSFLIITLLCTLL